MRIPLPNLVLLKHTLRMDNMHWGSYLLRAITLLFITISMVQVQVMSTFSPGVRAPGLQLFEIVAAINIFCVVVYAMSFSTTAITEEKEADSLALLLMTGITPISLLLGKAASKFVSGLTLVIAQIPFTVLAVTLGGISLTQIFACYVIIVAFMFLLCNMALFCSVIATRSVQASAFMFFLLGGCVLLRVNVPGTDFLTPFIKFGDIFSTGFDGTLITFESIVDIVLGLIIFALSCMIFNRFSRTMESSGPAATGKFKLSNFKFSKITRFRMGRPWKNALAWKEFHFVCGGWTIFALSWVLLFFSVGLVCYFEREYFNWTKDLPPIMLVIGLVSLAIKMLYLAATILGNELWDKTFQEIIVLPVSMREIIKQKLKGGLLMLVPAFCFTITGFFLVIYFNGIPEGRELTGIFSAIFSFSSSFVQLIYIVIFVSLCMRYGVIVIALLAHGILSIIMASSIGIFMAIVSQALGSSELTGILYALFYCIFSAASIFILHRMTRIRLRAALERACA